MKRDIDGVYFRVKRGEKWENICFTDMTQEERNFVLEGRNEEWLKSMVLHLANVIESIAEEFDLVRSDEE